MFADARASPAIMSRYEDADLVAQERLRANGQVPEHLAIIMDGNGRWARQRKLRRLRGHREGVRSVRDVVEACGQLGVKVLTLYTFSTENWNRSDAEVNALMKLLIRTLRQELQTFARNGIRLLSIGDRSKLPGDARVELEETIESCKNHQGMTLVLALSYSGRWEIAEAARKLSIQVKRGELAPDDINEETFSAALDTAGLPDPDLLIRTGSEIRISNFLLWQIAYAELYFTETYWPDFRRGHLYEAIRSFQDRERRFGRVLETS
jgi:undecaprenyl diphosphate synthase